eukprot:scaffold22315_cov90-Isochrysis_galbana.AAC.1
MASCSVQRLHVAQVAVAVAVCASASGRGDGGPVPPRTPAAGTPASHKWIPTPSCVTASVVPVQSHSQEMAAPLPNWCDRILARVAVSYTCTSSPRSFCDATASSGPRACHAGCSDDMPSSRASRMMSGRARMVATPWILSTASVVARGDCIVAPSPMTFSPDAMAAFPLGMAFRLSFLMPGARPLAAVGSESGITGGCFAAVGISITAGGTRRPCCTTRLALLPPLSLE